MSHLGLLFEMFLQEASFRNALPADESDLHDQAFSTQDGQIPLEDLHSVGNGGYVFWDNNMYVDIFVHISPGNWETVENDAQYSQLPNGVKTAYERMTGSPWPGPGNGAKRLSKLKHNN